MSTRRGFSPKGRPSFTDAGAWVDGGAGLDAQHGVALLSVPFPDLIAGILVGDVALTLDSDVDGREPRAFGYPDDLWTTRRLAEVIEKKYKVRFNFNSSYLA
jgi:hypothetical protein